VKSSRGSSRSGPERLIREGIGKKGVDKMVVKKKERRRGNFAYAKRTQKKSTLTTRYVTRQSLSHGTQTKFSKQILHNDNQLLEGTGIKINKFAYGLESKRNTAVEVESKRPEKAAKSTIQRA